MEKANDISKEVYEELTKEIVMSILHFCNRQLAGSTLDDEQKESLGVAKQCFEACYEMEDGQFDNVTDLIDVFHALRQTAGDVPLTPEQEAEAERFKVRGNDAMKDEDFELAVECYTKAIKINVKKAIYFCNRAAAHSRLERHRDAIMDCREAIKLDPNYGKAYGRLGIAYSNLQMFKEAADAYRKALELDPTNATYEANLKLAEEKIGPQGQAMNFDIGSFMNNPTLIGMASQMLSDPSFRNMVSGIMSSTPGGDPNLESFVEVGQRLAERMQSNNPDLLQNLRQTFGIGDQQGQGVFHPPTDKEDGSKTD